MKVTAVFNEYTYDVYDANVKVKLDGVEVCDSYVDIKRNGGSQNSDVIEICDISIEDVELWWPIGFGD